MIGSDAPHRSVVQDKGRINVVRIRQNARARVLVAGTSKPAARTLSVRSRQRRVVASSRIDSPEPGDVIEAVASARAALRRLPYNALISSQLIVAPGPRATHPGVAAKVMTSRGKLGEQNGYNCTRGPSAFRSPCPIVKAGLARVRSRADGLLDPGQPLYVNLVARAEPLLDRARAHHRVRVRDPRVRITRYGGG